MPLTAKQRKLCLACLQSLREDALRADVLVPLYKAMNYVDVVETHGPDEFGKDIVFKEIDRLGEHTNGAIVAKKDKIHGASARTGNVEEVLTQAREAFRMPFRDRLDGYAKKRIAAVHVVTAETITPKARAYISETLGHDGLHGVVRFVDGERLLDLVTAHCPQVVESWLREKPKTTRLDDDLYPRLIVAFGATASEAIEVEADFDLGASQSFLSYEVALSAGICDEPRWRPRSGLFLGAQFQYLPMILNISLDGVTFAKVPVSVVRDWDKSPFVIANQNRVMVLGRDCPRILGARVLLDFGSGECSVVAEQ